MFTLNTCIPALLSYTWFILLCYSYHFFVTPIFFHEGFGSIILESKILEASIIILFLSFMLGRKVDRPSRAIIQVVFYTSMIPLLSYYCMADAETEYLYLMVFQFVLVFIFSQIHFPSSERFFKPIAGGQRIALYICYFFVILVLGRFLIFGGLSALNLDLMLVYDFREEAEEAYSSGLAAYYVSWTLKVFNIILIIDAIYRKSILRIIIFSFIQILFFGFSAHKAILFYPLVVLGSYLVFKLNKPLYAIFFALSTVILLSLSYYYYTGNIVLGSLFIRRTFFTPVFLNFFYYDFFKEHELVYWSNSIFSFFLTYPYDLPTAFLIGAELGSKELGANTGILATSYMHFGYFGIFLFPLIVAFLFRLLDSMHRTMPLWLLTGVTIIPFTTLYRSTDLLTGIMTHGLGVALLMLWLLNSERDWYDNFTGVWSR